MGHSVEADRVVAEAGAGSNSSDLHIKCFAVLHNMCSIVLGHSNRYHCSGHLELVKATCIPILYRLKYAAIIRCKMSYTTLHIQTFPF